MPVVQIDCWRGSSVHERARTVKEVTEAVVRGIGCPAEAVTVIIREVDQSYWGRGGELARGTDI
ncbi:MAG TPA: tautomerase family protein [Streptomyces sp.]